MKWLKLIMSLVVLGLIALFIWENVPTFTREVPFRLNLYFQNEVTWAHRVYTLIFFGFFAGLVAGAGLMLKPYLNLRRVLSQERQDKTSTPPPEESSAPPSDKPSETP